MTHMIEATGVVKRFRDTTALDGLELFAEQGAILAVLGPNGAGKTTFVRCIATLLEPDAGTLRVFGHDVVREPHVVQSSIGLGRAVRRRRADHDRAREPGDGRAGCSGRTAPRPVPTAPACSGSWAWSTTPIGWCGPTRAACAASSTSARAWSAVLLLVFGSIAVARYRRG
jgi:energy-coupling factor transporter ATP-binding protein EcfA2